VVIASPMGGMNIEDVAVQYPDKMFKYPVDLNGPMPDELAMEIAKNLDFTSEHIKPAAEVFKNLYEIYRERDMLLVEINPVALDNFNKREF
jgi:succinyl-CoA synthetase beta subunit